MNIGKINNEYTSNHIRTLEGMEHIRQYPGMYVGSVTENGLHHILLEIVSNSIDEYLNGSGTTIKVTLKKDGYVIVSDDARGVPHGVMEDGVTTTLQSVFGTINTGGKYDNDGESGYNTSGGQHGVGAKAANALSSSFVATSTREGKREIVVFAEGKFLKGSSIEHKTETTGTTVMFKPDATIFETVEYDAKRIEVLLRDLSFLCKGLTFVLTDERPKEKTQITLKSENGLKDSVAYLNKDKETITTIFHASSSEGKSGIEVAMQYNTTYSDNVKLYTNNIPNQTGTHLTGFRTALTRAINDYARENKILKEKDSNLTGDDLKEGQTLVINLKMLKPIYEGQHKESMTSSEGRTIAEKLAGEELRVWLRANPSAAKTIINKALSARTAREAAKKAREASRKKTAKALPNIISDKLADCTSKVPAECEIFLTEGDSAGGSAKQGRDRYTQAILSLKGKVLNTCCLDMTKILSNQEIRDIVDSIGCGIGEAFDISKRRYDKVIILADADPDGQHICTLLMTLMYKYMKPLIAEGHLYIGMPPLYQIIMGKEVHYAADNDELDIFKKQHPNRKFDVHYLKGLGELSPQELLDTTIDRTKRRLKKVVIQNDRLCLEKVEELMGKSADKRKEFITKNAYRANI